MTDVLQNQVDTVSKYQDLAPILERVGLSGELWCDLVNRFGKIFKRVAGTPESLAQEAIRRGQSGYRTGGSPLPA